jgi:hypothetical protein
MRSSSRTTSNVYAFAYFSPKNRAGTVILTTGANGESLLPILDRLGDNATLLKAMHTRLD